MLQNLRLIKNILFISILLPLAALSQDNAGINFNESLTWNEVIQKAKAENKYVFVDCYTTWCGPCKKMDQVVYPASEVGRFMNQRFISVKIQMDSTKRDNAGIKKKYALAKEFADRYRVVAYPSYLFFSPEGRIVHRGDGFKSSKDFLQLVGNALDPTKQCYTLIEEYKKGKKDYKLMPYLAKDIASQILRDPQLAIQIAKDYNENYLNTLSNKQLLDEEVLKFVAWYPGMLNSSDRYFELFYNNANEVDSVMKQNGFSQNVVDGVIRKEEVVSKIYNVINGRYKPIEGLKPDWSQIERNIRKKYGTYNAERNTLAAKITWYHLKRDWNNAIKYEVKKIDKYGLDTTFMGRFGVNNMVYDLILNHCENKKVLNKAANWMYKIIEIEGFKDAASIDTYANVLYKAGNKKDALVWQERAIKLDPESKSLALTLDKMKRNHPTWSTDNQ